MADKRISSSKADFTIPKFTNKNETKDIVIKLPDTNKYDVYQKDFPVNLPQGYIWINSFGIKHRRVDENDSSKTHDSSSDDPYPDTVDAYQIELDDVEGKEPVYFDGKQVRSFPSGKVSLGNNKIHVNLALGDPPVGWPK